MRTPIDAIVFDAYGTLYDVQSVLAAATEACGGQGLLVTQLWRLKQLEYTWLRGLGRRYEDFRVVTRDALEFALDAAGLAAEPALCETLMARYLALDLHAEAREALDELRAQRRTLAILSNGTQAMLDALVRSSGLDGVFAHVLSVDAVRSYKPDPACYALSEAALGVPPARTLFVSSNGFDVAGAKAFGFQVAWVERSAAEPAATGAAPSEMFRALRGRAERLGADAVADHHVARLTDLVAVAAG